MSRECKVATAVTRPGGTCSHERRRRGCLAATSRDRALRSRSRASCVAAAGRVAPPTRRSPTRRCRRSPTRSSPGRKATTTDLGNAIHPQAIAGVDSCPGAVEADALALYHHPLTGFDALEPRVPRRPRARALAARRRLPVADVRRARRRSASAGLAFDNPDRLLWEAAAAVPFTAFCAAALVPEQTAAKASRLPRDGAAGRRAARLQGLLLPPQARRASARKQGYLA